MATRNSFLPGDQYNPNDPTAYDPSYDDPTGVMNTPLPTAPATPSAPTPTPTPATADPSLLGPNYTGPLPASFGGPPTTADQVPVPSVNPGVVFTDASGKGYTPDQLYAARNTLLQDPTNARVGDLLTQYGYGAPPTAKSTGGGGGAAPAMPTSPAGFSLPDSALGTTVDNGLTSLIGHNGMTPEQTSVLAEVNKIIGAGGALPSDSTLEQQQLETARENEAHAFGAQLGDARDELASRGLVSEPGVPQGSEAEAIDNITRGTAPAYAQAVRDVSTTQIQTQNARLTSAIATATGLTNDAAGNLVSSLGTGSQRQLGLASIALDSLSQNAQWNEFLANYGLNRDQVLNSIQNGNVGSLMTLLQLFQTMAGTTAGGHI